MILAYPRFVASEDLIEEIRRPFRIGHIDPLQTDFQFRIAHIGFLRQLIRTVMSVRNKEPMHMSIRHGERLRKIVRNATIFSSIKTKGYPLPATISTMIRELHEEDRQAILDYAYLQERENLFPIGSLNHADAFAVNRYFGWFAGEELRGIAAVFGKWGSFVVHAQEQSILHALVDRVVEEKIPFTDIPAFRKFSGPMVEYLKTVYGRESKKVSEETVYVLEKGSFRPAESRAVPATEEDRDSCARFDKDDPETPVTEKERARVIPEDTFVIHRDGMLIAKANAQGFSKHFAQIGGVMTHPSYRRQGCARQCVSALCRYCFSRGVENVLLFTANTNLPAQNLYRSLGFKPVDEFLIAEYA